MRVAPVLLAAVPFVFLSCGGGGGGGGTAPPPPLSVTAPASTIVSGTSVQAVATIGGAPAPAVSWSTSSAAIASVSPAGLITGHLIGNAVITAQSGSSGGQMTVSVTVGAPATVIIYAGNSQTGDVGSQLPDPLCTNVRDAAGNLIIGAVVTYTVASGGGQLAAPTSPPTDLTGIATSGRWTLGGTVGTQTVTASSGSAVPVTFSATAR